MQIIIEIPTMLYLVLKLDGVLGYPRLTEIIRNGTPLPKGHGDLKDMGNLQYVFDLTREDPIYSGKDIERAIKSMTSIIEADKGVGDADSD